MKVMIAAALALVAAPALAQTAPAPAPRFTTATPIEQIVADPKAKAVLDADVPGVSTHPMYEQFKGMSLSQLAPMSQGKITDTVLAKAQADLAAVK